MVQQGSFSLTDKETGREYKFSNAAEFLEFSQQLREACEWVQKAGREQSSPRILAQKLGGHLDKLESFARHEA
ncbi:hypothetical protein [Ruegeria sp. HKCCD6604]|uniref:hypothetical protein n=1 Tax=Ruegeria sp. HKCCD6604 TaxID=2683000 RepID=UPI0014931605|nr:hypothetical protein [Ruegeria sp. HKCCD6604]NOC94482.1 hypothetical protein [Ruegeria sp. HKCCD6604]